MQKTKTGLSFLFISLIALMIDLVSKYVIVSHFELYETLKLIPHFDFTYVRNYGSAFSFLGDHNGWQKYLFIILSVVVSGFLVYLLRKNSYTKRLQNISYSLLIGGAMGNAIDRSVNGYVIDFFDFYIGSWHYPIFNIADIAIVCGVGILVIENLFSKEEKGSK